MTDDRSAEGAERLAGLTDAEVRERIDSGLVNGDQNIKTKSVGRILIGNVCTLFNLISVVIAVILIIFNDKPEGEPFGLNDISNFGFFFVMLTNLAIGIAQELKAKRTIDRLSLLSAPKVTVVRNGAETDIALKDIVMDDIVRLSSGRQICADATVVSGSIDVNESLITGEPDAVPKRPGDELLSGSFAVSGNADCRVIRLGKDNYAAKISSGAKYIKAYPSEIRGALIKFIRIMGFLIIPVGLALFAVKHIAQGNPLTGTIHTVAGNLIGMIPSGLVMLTSAVFCVSVVRLARRKALAQDLYCVETLARADMLCLDKTGTLTEGSLDVERVVSYRDDVDARKIMKCIVDSTGDNNVTAEAIKAHCADAEWDFDVARALPFSSKRKFSAVQIGRRAYVLGAPERVLRSGAGARQAAIDEFVEQGRRVLALTETSAFKSTSLPEKFRLIALVVMSDRIRPEAPDTLRFFAEQGVEIKIISGDNPVTVSKIAERTGVKGYDRYVDATLFETEAEMSKALDSYVIFGRSTPEQKLAFVKLLRKKGHTVAMTGDGVNDVLALRESDCSIAMASGSDAAKNVSQLVLLDDNFSNLPRAVAEGRRTINNLERSASLFLVKTLYNLFFALVFLFLTDSLPFEPKHMTFIGALTIGIPSTVLALEPNKELVKGKFFRKIVRNALPASLTVVICVVAATLSARLYPAGTLSKKDVSTICTIIAAAIGFMFIAKLSYPFNALRATMLILLIGAFVGAFFLRAGDFSAPDFYGLTSVPTKEMLLILAPVAALGAPIFAGLTFLVDAIGKRMLKRKEIRAIYENEE